MTRVLILLAVLYIIWRVSTVFGRRRRLEYEARFRHDEGTVELVRCSVCGSYVDPADVHWEGRWPFQKPICRAHDAEAGEGRGQPRS